MTDYKELKNPPLVFALADFRFSTVLSIEDYIPVIQDELRKKYPIFEHHSGRAVMIQPEGPTLVPLDRWEFISENDKNAIQISRERLVYFTGEYTGFEDLSGACKLALETVEKFVEPNLSLRIGLRYGYLVMVEDDEDITQLVHASFGEPSCFKDLGETEQYQTETFSETTSGVLHARTLYGYNGLSCLEDVQKMPISITQNRSPSERMILDFDHFWVTEEEAVKFETKSTLEQLASLPETCTNAFWKITTDYARSKKWA